MDVLAILLVDVLEVLLVDVLAILLVDVLVILLVDVLVILLVDVLEVSSSFREISEIAILLIVFRQSHVHMGGRPLRAANAGDEMVARGRNRRRSAAEGHLLLAVEAGVLHAALALDSSVCIQRCEEKSGWSRAPMPSGLAEVISRPCDVRHHEAS